MKESKLSPRMDKDFIVEVSDHRFFCRNLSHRAVMRRMPGVVVVSVALTAIVRSDVSATLRLDRPTLNVLADFVYLLVNFRLVGDFFLGRPIRDHRPNTCANNDQ